jgi:hypothetical protein
MTTALETIRCLEPAKIGFARHGASPPIPHRFVAK